MTDIDFCEHLLENTNFPAKKKAQMIGRVAKFFGESASNPTQLCEGITFDGFRSFYHVMYCGADLERAMYFCDLDHGGITKDEFLEFSMQVGEELLPPIEIPKIEILIQNRYEMVNIAQQ